MSTELSANAQAILLLIAPLPLVDKGPPPSLSARVNIAGWRASSGSCNASPPTHVVTHIRKFWTGPTGFKEQVSKFCVGCWHVCHRLTTKLSRGQAA